MARGPGAAGAAPVGQGGTRVSAVRRRLVRGRLRGRPDRRAPAPPRPARSRRGERDAVRPRALAAGHRAAAVDDLRRLRDPRARQPRTVGRRGRARVSAARGGRGLRRPRRRPPTVVRLCRWSRCAVTAAARRASASTSWRRSERTGPGDDGCAGGDQRLRRGAHDAAGGCVPATSPIARGSRSRSSGPRWRRSARRVARTRCTRWRPAGSPRLEFMAALSEQLTRARGQAVSLAGFGEALFSGMAPNEPVRGVHARAPRTRPRDGDLHQQRPGVVGALAGDDPGRRAVRRRHRLLRAGRAQARPADLSRRRSPRSALRPKRRCSSTTCRSTARRRPRSGCGPCGFRRPSRRSPTSKPRWTATATPRRSVRPGQARAAALLAASALLAAGCGSDHRLPPLPVMHVAPGTPTLHLGPAGVAVPAGFLGLSMEFQAVREYTGADPQAVDPVLVRLIRDLSPGQRPVLRIGGDSTDVSWVPAAGSQAAAVRRLQLSAHRRAGSPPPRRSPMSCTRG